MIAPPVRAGSLASRIHDAIGTMLTAGDDVTCATIADHLCVPKSHVPGRLAHLEAAGLVTIERRKLPHVRKPVMFVVAVRPLRNRRGDLLQPHPEPNEATAGSLRRLTSEICRRSQAAAVTTSMIYAALDAAGWTRVRIRTTLHAALEAGYVVKIGRPLIDGLRCDTLAPASSTRRVSPPTRTPGWNRVAAWESHDAHGTPRPRARWVVPALHEIDTGGARLTQIEVAKIVARMKAAVAPPPEPEPVPDIIVTEMRRTVTAMPTGGRPAIPELARGTAPVRSVDVPMLLDDDFAADLRDLFGAVQNNP